MPSPIYAPQKPKYIWKPADTARTTNTNYDDDPDLFFQLQPNQAVNFTFWTRIMTASATPGMRVTLNGPASPAYLRWNQFIQSAAQTVITGFGQFANIYAGGFTTATALASGAFYCKVEGYVRNGPNVGNLVIQWGQNTSSADATTMLQGSYLLVYT